MSSPITGLYRANGELEGVRIDYEAMTPAEREDIIAWVKAHQIDPALVPVQVDIGYDPITEEWRFPLYVRAPQRGLRADPATGRLAQRVIRRRCLPIAFLSRRPVRAA